MLTVGSDCAIGKMTVVAGARARGPRRGLAAVFVPTGQTGIAIAGWGLSVDAVVADFIAGAAERLVVEAAGRGGELLLVEGQGAITHPAYSGVTLGLLHGAAPHALVLCHRAGDVEVEGYAGHPLLPLPELVDLYQRVGLSRHGPVVACVAINTAHLDDARARARSTQRSGETGPAADDPVRFGPAYLLDAVLARPGNLCTLPRSGEPDHRLWGENNRSHAIVAVALALVALACARHRRGSRRRRQRRHGQVRRGRGHRLLRRMAALGPEADRDDGAFPPGEPDTIQGKAFLDKAVPEASCCGT